MDLKENNRRAEISRYLTRGDFNSIESLLGIKKVGEKDPFDCAAFVLHSLGLPATPEILRALQTLPYSTQATCGIVAYKRFNSIAHFGFYSGKVRSKWGFGPVFEHSIEDVPIEYGDKAVFIDKSKAYSQLMLAHQLSHFKADF